MGAKKKTQKPGDLVTLTCDDPSVPDEVIMFLRTEKKEEYDVHYYLGGDGKILTISLKRGTEKT